LKTFPDRFFLRKLLEAQGIQVEEKSGNQVARSRSLRAWLKHIFGGGS